jgi:hypothetical protein
MVFKAAFSPENTADVNQIRQGYIPENIICTHRREKYQILQQIIVYIICGFPDVQNLLFGGHFAHSLADVLPCYWCTTSGVNAAIQRHLDININDTLGSTQR